MHDLGSRVARVRTFPDALASRWAKYLVVTARLARRREGFGEARAGSRWRAFFLHSKRSWLGDFWMQRPALDRPALFEEPLRQPPVPLPEGVLKNIRCGSRVIAIPN